MAREQIEWKCNECHETWVGDETDFGCDHCDGDNISPLNHTQEYIDQLLKERQQSFEASSQAGRDKTNV